MADKKITALTSATSGASEDLLHIVADPAGTPINKKLTIKNFASGLAHTSLAAEGNTSLEFFDVDHTVNLAAATGVTGISTSLAVTTTTVGATSGVKNVDRNYTIDVTNYINDANVAVTNESAVMRLTLDRGNEDAASNTTYGLVIRHANTAAATAQPPTAFIKVEDRTIGTDANTVFIMDVLPGGAYGTAAGNNTLDIAAAAGTTSNEAGYLRVQVLGQTRYIRLYTTSAP